MASELAIASLPGVSAANAKKLENAGMEDVMAVLTHGVPEIKDAVGCDDASALLIQRKCREAVEASGIMQKTIMTARDMLEEREDMVRIKSGTSKKLDAFLGGGLEPRALTEVWGQFGCGKTQIALQYSVQAQRPVEEGGLGKSVIYIDSENTFRPERIMTMAEARGMDAGKALDGIIVMKALNAGHQRLLLDRAIESVKRLGAGLIVIDSITKHFRGEYSAGQGWLARRQQALGAHIHTLVTAAQLYDFAALVTNQVVSKPGITYGRTEEAVGGNIMGHASTYRIQMRKNKGAKRVLKMDDSPGSAQNEIVVHISDGGFVDEMEEGK